MCNELGCPACDQLGYYLIPGCPKETIDQELLNCVSVIDFAKRGVMPVIGGSLDQSNWFLDAFHFMLEEERRTEAENWKD